MIRFTCPTCRKVLKAAPDWAGRKTKCKKCGQLMVIPGVTSPTPNSTETDQLLSPVVDTSSGQLESASSVFENLTTGNEAAPIIPSARRQRRARNDWVSVWGISLVIVLAAVGCVAVLAVMVVADKKAPPPGDMTLTEFILQKPSKPTAVQVYCKLDTYYNFAYASSAETHYSFRIEDSRYTSTHVYAPKNSEYGRRLYEMLKNGSERKITLRIQRLGPDGSPLPAEHHDSFALIGIVDDLQRR